MLQKPLSGFSLLQFTAGVPARTKGGTIVRLHTEARPLRPRSRAKLVRGITDAGDTLLFRPDGRYFFNRCGDYDWIDLVEMVN